MMEESAHHSVASAVQETVRANKDRKSGQICWVGGTFPCGYYISQPPHLHPHTPTPNPSGRSISVLVVVNKAILNTVIKKKEMIYMYFNMFFFLSEFHAVMRYRELKLIIKLMEKKCLNVL